MHNAKKTGEKKKKSRFSCTKEAAQKKKQHLQFQSLLNASWSKNQGRGTMVHVCLSVLQGLQQSREAKSL